MTKEYKHVRLEMPVYDTLKTYADKEKKSISRYIEKLLTQMLTTPKHLHKKQHPETAYQAWKACGAWPHGSSNPPLSVAIIEDDSKTS
jgi:hypothetical protein